MTLSEFENHNPVLTPEIESNMVVVLVQDANLKQLADATNGQHIAHAKGETVLWDFGRGRFTREKDPKTEQIIRHSFHWRDGREGGGEVTDFCLVIGEKFAAIVGPSHGDIFGIRMRDGRFSEFTENAANLPQFYSDARDRSITARLQSAKNSR
jgi:hypothetical protein